MAHFWCFTNALISNSSGDLDTFQDTTPPIIRISSGKLCSNEPRVNGFPSKAKFSKLFFVKAQIVHISSYGGHKVPISTAQLNHYSRKQLSTIDKQASMTEFQQDFIYRHKLELQIILTYKERNCGWPCLSMSLFSEVANTGM